MHKEAQSRYAVEKATVDLKLDFERQDKEMKEVKKAHASAEAGVKNAEKQAEELHVKLHQSEEKLTAEQQAVSTLEAELARTKEEARLAREAAEKAVAALYERAVHDTEARIAEEVAIVCREYITTSWNVALDRADVPADSDLRKAENIFFPEDVREIPDEDASKEPLPTDSSILEAGGNEQAVQDKPPEDSLSINEIVAQAKKVAPGTQVADDQPNPAQGP